MIRAKTLIALTVALFVVGIFSTIDDDLGIPLALLPGFIYSPILIASLRKRPNLTRSALGIFFLGVANYFILYTSAPIILIQDYLSDLAQYVLFYMLPSLSGCLLTYLVMRYLWRISFPKNSLITLMAWIAAASLIAAPIAYYAHREFGKDLGGIWVLNGLFWCLAFSICLSRLWSVKSNLVSEGS